MTFMVVLISAVIVWRGFSLRALQQDFWFDRWQGLLTALPFPRVLLIWLAVLLPAVAIYALVHRLGENWLGFFTFLAALLVLLYSLGRGGLDNSLSKYQEMIRADDRQAAAALARQFAGSTSAELNAAASATELEQGAAIDEQPEDSQRDFASVQKSIEQQLLYERFQAWFAVVFWFALLGPAMALLYRLLQLVRDTDASIGRALYFLEWLPARLLSLTYGVVGHFDGVLENARDFFTAGDSTAANLHLAAEATLLPHDSADAAPEPGQSLDRLQRLENSSRRALVVWMVAAALLQILS